MDWTEAQKFESSWWGDCINTFAEEAKQITYAHRMGLSNVSDGAHWPYYDLQGKSILDIGGGPVSMLLKCHNRGRCAVADPCDYPEWIRTRYDVANIEYRTIAGERLTESPWLEGDKFDEAWIYNVLQHTDDPQKIIENARTLAKAVRIFEWIDIPAHPGHPQELKANLLSEWLKGFGQTEDFRPKPENGCNQVAFYGLFPV